MRHVLTGLLVLLLAGCTLFEPSSRRFIVFFKADSPELTDGTDEVIAAAADWAKDHPTKPVTIAAFTDTHGTPESNADLARERAQTVFDSLVRNGVPATRIARREVGPVQYQIDPQESRRVVVTVGTADH